VQELVLCEAPGNPIGFACDWVPSRQSQTKSFSGGRNYPRRSRILESPKRIATLCPVWAQAGLSLYT
jgi:hypothetical protein